MKCIRYLLIFFSFSVGPVSQALAEPIRTMDYIGYAKLRVQEAIKGNSSWSGPIAGPQMVRGKSVIFVASDLRNGGVNAVAKGVSEAISHTNWNLSFFDGLGSEVRQGAAIRKAVGFKPDGIVLCGIDAERHSDVLQLAKTLDIKVVGWHATDQASSDDSLGLFTNITTDPAEVAEVASLLAVADSDGQAKVVIFTDPNYSIARMKSGAMIASIKRCKECELIAIQEIPLAETAKKMPVVIDRLLTEHPGKITHFLAINDLYFDFGTPSLEIANEKSIRIPASISAGDGSKAAYKRIRKKKYQLATVPEPLHLHGWQIVDELNRAFSDQRPSGYSAPVHLVTQDNFRDLIGKGRVDIYDPDNGYRKAYMTIWNPR